MRMRSGLTDSPIMSGTGVHSTPVSIKESSFLTESVIISDPGIHSTPVSTKDCSESDHKMMK